MTLQYRFRETSIIHLLISWNLIFYLQSVCLINDFVDVVFLRILQAPLTHSNLIRDTNNNYSDRYIRITIKQLRVFVLFVQTSPNFVLFIKIFYFTNILRVNINSLSFLIIPPRLKLIGKHVPVGLSGGGIPPHTCCHSSSSSAIECALIK